VLEELLTAEVLEVRVLDPALAQHLIGQIITVLEDRQPRHQSRRQRWPTWFVGIDRPEFALEEPPINRQRKSHQPMIEIDDLIQPRTK